MKNEDTPSVISYIRSCLRRGAFQEADKLIAPLSDAELADPAIALLLTQLRMGQGDMLKAQAALRAIDEKGASTTQQVMMHLYDAQLLILSAADFDQALAMVASTRELTREQADGDRAEAEFLIERLRLVKQTYLPDSPDVAHSARETIERAANVLEACGRLDQALSARLTWADDLEERSVGLAQLAQATTGRIVSTSPSRSAK